MKGKNTREERVESTERGGDPEGREIESIITLAEHQELEKKQKSGRKKRRSMGKFIFPCYNQSLAKRNTQ